MVAFLIPPPPVTSVVSEAIQAAAQLLAAGLLDQVDAWIKTQSKAVQITCECSGTFVRTEPMMAVSLIRRSTPSSLPRRGFQISSGQGPSRSAAPQPTVPGFLAELRVISRPRNRVI